MFGKETKDTRPTNNGSGANAVNIIGAGTVVEGDIKSEGDLRIDGKVKGHVFSKAKVAIGPTGSVEGDVTSENADVSGKVFGTMKTDNMLFLKGSAHVEGDVIVGKFVVESGATFNGTCKMHIKEIKANVQSNASLKKEAVG